MCIFPGIPDAPFDLRFINATHNSMTLSWKPGFDGGSTQRFQMRYRETPSEPKKDEEKSEAYKYEDVQPAGSTIYTIRGWSAQKIVRVIKALIGHFSAWVD